MECTAATQPCQAKKSFFGFELDPQPAIKSFQWDATTKSVKMELNVIEKIPRFDET